MAKEKEFICKNCGTSFTQFITKTGKTIHGDEPKQYCSYTCSNIREIKNDTKVVHCSRCRKRHILHKHSPAKNWLCDECKQKDKIKRGKLFRYRCSVCSTYFISKKVITERHLRVCSKECASNYDIKYPRVDIKEYMKKPLGSRKRHLALEQPCILGKTANSHRNRKALARKLNVTEPRGRICVCHACNNKYCINVNHVYFGTDRENLVIDGLKFGTLKLSWVGKQKSKKKSKK